MEERHLSLSEAARALDISERTAYRWIKSGKLRAYKPGHEYWILESTIKELIEGSEVRPKAARAWELPEDAFLAWLDGATDDELEELRDELGALLAQDEASRPRLVGLEAAKAHSKTEESRRGQLVHRRTLQVIRYRQERLKAELERLEAEEAKLVGA